MLHLIALATILTSLVSSTSPIKRNVATPQIEWIVKGLDFHASYTFTTPAHQNTWGFISFNISNNLVDYTTSCAANSNQLYDFFYGDIAYACAPAPGAPLGAGANFKLNKRTGQLDFEEYIPNGETSTPMHGSTNVTFTCTDTTTVNKEWVIGEVYSQRDVRCAPVDVTFAGN